MSSKLIPFWNNLELFSFESLTIITRTSKGRRKKYQFGDGHQMISFYESQTGISFGGKRCQDPERLLQWR